MVEEKITYRYANSVIDYQLIYLYLQKSYLWLCDNSTSFSHELKTAIREHKYAEKLCIPKSESEGFKHILAMRGDDIIGHVLLQEAENINLVRSSKFVDLSAVIPEQKTGEILQLFVLDSSSIAVRYSMIFIAYEILKNKQIKYIVLNNAMEKDSLYAKAGRKIKMFTMENTVFSIFLLSVDIIERKFAKVLERMRKRIKISENEIKL